LKVHSEQLDDNTGSWGRALIFGLPAAGLILALFAYWFAFADRYVIFLYFHDMGPRVPDTAPFSRVTASRYWMAGLVAAGAVMLLYVSANWLLGRLSKRVHAPRWWRVWLVAALPLLLGIPAITMHANEPVLPWTLAMQVTLVTLAGLALALLPGELAARSPARLLWLAADGWGLALILLTLPHTEDFRLWLSMGSSWPLTMSLLLMLFGLAWLLLLSFVRTWLCIPVDGSTLLFLAGCCVAYLLLPFVHHTLATDGYFYLTNSDNFFARGLGAQLWAWLATALVAWSIVRLRVALSVRRKPEET
jgi:uncharacterized membrane protein (DUF485 family)